MQIGKININNPYSSPYFANRKVQNISFGQKVNSVASSSKKLVEELVQKYIKNFDVEQPYFQKGGNDILQPSMIPLDLLHKIADISLKEMQKFPKNREFCIVTGRIGSGKTSFVERMHLNQLFYTPDADKIKLLLPGYETKGASYVHIASCAINNANISMACKNGINTLCQTSTTFGNLDNIIDEARDYNYDDIVMIYIDTNEENAIKRAMQRGELTGRKIDPDVIKERKYIDSIVPTYKTPLRGLSQIIVYNNNGTTPIKVEEVTLKTPPAELKYVTESSD